jgi:hypothetical protein
MTQLLKLSLTLSLLIITSTSLAAFGESPKTAESESPKIVTVAKDTIPEKWSFKLSLTTPHPGWILSIDTVYQSNNRVGVLANVSVDPEGLFPQVISKQEKTILIKGPQYPVTVIIMGKTWGWANPDEPYLFVNDLSELSEENKILFQAENDVSFKIKKNK